MRYVVFDENATQDKIRQYVSDMAREGIELAPLNPREAGYAREYVVLGSDTANAHLIESSPIVARTYVESVERALYTHVDTRCVNVGDVTIGSRNVVVMAGPCSIDTMDNLDIIARGVKQAGARILRGGAFKPRTSPHTFQGLGERGVEMLSAVGARYTMPVVSEIVSIRDIDLFADKVDMIQIGARNMQNYDLLCEVGRLGKPVLLKRGFGNTIEELLGSMEYIVRGGSEDIVLVERGVRAVANGARNTLDITAVPILKARTGMPVVVDPSHSAGDSSLVRSLTLASIAAGADGVIIETHNKPNEALSDGKESITPSELSDIIARARRVAEAVEREI